MIQDNEVQLKWPETKYDKLALKINRVFDPNSHSKASDTFN